MNPEDPKPKEIELPHVGYVIFDRDGTLAESMQSYADAFVQVMGQEFAGVDDRKVREYYLSRPSGVLSNQFKEAAQMFAQKDVAETVDLESKMWNAILDLGPPTVIEGAPEALKHLKEKGLKIAVWSGTRTDVIGKKLEQTGLDQYVDFFIGNVPGSETLIKGPGLFAKIAEHFQITIEELQQQSLVLGDGTNDMLAGQTAGAAVLIGVKGLKSKEQLTTAGANLVISGISNLSKLFS